MCSVMEHSERSYREEMARQATAAHQDALGDYYDSGAIGDPPKRYMFEKTETTEND